jgi:uncharacterized protein YyaL (SSP411 family)
MSDTIPPGANRLIFETSPYLLQHAYNPVAWMPWGQEAFDMARSRGCPILLSVGYAACHWCHVMERESFSDPGIADVMNRHFVCIKVDREERPDVDALYMHATQAMTGQGGWPMTAFLTPDGKPFYAGTYFPPEPRHGMPAFRQVLEAVADAWANRRDVIDAQADCIAADIRRGLEHQGEPEPLTSGLVEQAFAAMARYEDAQNGGFGTAPKFPQPMLIEFLLRTGARTGRPAPTDVALRALHAMAAGGMHDQVAGGFHRYSVDAGWLVPHFEKMLYDNAQLASAYMLGWKLTGDRALLRVAERTLDFMRLEMALPCGGFIASYDADSEGEEGLYYTWTPDEIAEVLGADAADACTTFGVTAPGHVDGRSVIHRAVPEWDDPRVDTWLRRLAEARAGRIAPRADTKVIAAWNGLALSAFAQAAMHSGRADYLQTARNSGAFLLDALCETDASGSIRVLHSGIEAAEETPHHPSAIARTFRPSGIGGFLDDYALVAEGLLHLFEATGEPRWFQAARGIADAMLEWFASDGPLMHGVAPAECSLFANPVPSDDNPIPSGNAVAAQVCFHLADLTGETRYEVAAVRALRSMAAFMSRYPAAFGRWLCALDMFLGPRAIVVVTRPDGSSKDDAVAAAALCRRRPGIAVFEIAPDAGTDPDLPAAVRDKPPVGRRTTAYVCAQGTCRGPFTAAEELDAAMDAMTAR